MFKRVDVSDGRYKLIVHTRGQSPPSKLADSFPPLEALMRRPSSVVIVARPFVGVDGAVLADKGDVVVAVQGIEVHSLNHEVVGFLIRILRNSCMHYSLELVPFDVFQKTFGTSEVAQDSGVVSSWTSYFLGNDKAPTPDSANGHKQRLLVELDRLRDTRNIPRDKLLFAQRTAATVHIAVHLAMLCLQYFDLAPLNPDTTFASDPVYDRSLHGFYSLLVLCCHHLVNDAPSTFSFSKIVSQTDANHQKFVVEIFRSCIELIFQPNDPRPLSREAHNIFHASIEEAKATGERVKVLALQSVVVKLVFSYTNSSLRTRFTVALLDFAKRLKGRFSNSENPQPEEPPAIFVGLCCFLAKYLMYDADPQMLFFLAETNKFQVESACSIGVRVKSAGTTEEEVSEAGPNSAAKALSIRTYPITVVLNTILGTTRVLARMFADSGPPPKSRSLFKDRGGHVALCSSGLLEFVSQVHAAHKPTDRTEYQLVEIPAEEWESKSAPLLQQASDAVGAPELTLDSRCAILSSCLAFLVQSCLPDALVPCHMYETFVMAGASLQDNVELAYAMRQYAANLSRERKDVLFELCALLEVVERVQPQDKPYMMNLFTGLFLRPAMAMTQSQVHQMKKMEPISAVLTQMFLSHNQYIFHRIPREELLLPVVDVVPSSNTKGGEFATCHGMIGDILTITALGNEESDVEQFGLSS